MASSFSSKSRLDRRIHQLGKESELVRSDIRLLSRALRNRDELDRLPKLKSGKSVEHYVPPPTRHDPVRTGAPPQPVAPPMPPKMVEADMLASPSHAPSRVAPRDTKPASPAAVSGGDAVHPRALRSDERFANLFSSGGFLGSVNARQERNVQKNKAIFMVLVVLVVFFIVYRLVF